MHDCMIGTYIGFILGEEKYVDFKVVPEDKNASVSVASASWRLFDASGGITDLGECEISGSVISALLNPQSKGNFTLEITAAIPPETRKSEVRIVVS